ncbi:MAG: UDP-N-acetylmuramate--L-alanine ligase [Oscillospiraceae bacterium]|jgi:UDP-N-acetylmuramate--alanine ligase|nr:UDP-N-acetylmuramate--L-alanine ligase [Oscillospiraceae bacterium]
MTDFLKGKKQIHFIGIGGSGMYPLAQILHTQGYNITGSDNNETVTLEAIRKMGIKVHLGHNAANLGDSDLVIYSSAISGVNPELRAANEAGITTRDRAELLGLFTSRHDKAVCVVGTHGKTTATSMLVHILMAAKLDISAFVGGKLKLIDGSARIGNSGIMAVEACEFNNNFLKLAPDIAVILNIDEDHMDFFKNMDNLRKSYSDFCNLTSDLVIMNGDCINTKVAVMNSDYRKEIITFGFSETNNYYPKNIKKLSDFETSFELFHNGESLGEIIISVPGEHNVLNAVAACAAGLYIGTDFNALREGLHGFTGAGRRFERIYNENGITVVDDYAHHPLEVEVTLKAAKNMDCKRVWAVHQPFTFSRTKALLDDFASALEIADKVVLSAIMGGREVDPGDIKSEDLAEKIAGAVVIQDFEGIAEYVAQNAESGDLIITMGCGDVDKCARLIAGKLEGE